jgi:hypothetical protein
MNCWSFHQMVASGWSACWETDLAPIQPDFNLTNPIQSQSQLIPFVGNPIGARMAIVLEMCVRQAHTHNRAPVGCREFRQLVQQKNISDIRATFERAIDYLVMHRGCSSQEAWEWLYCEARAKHVCLDKVARALLAEGTVDYGYDAPI